MFLFLFVLSKSFPKIRTIIPVGVTTKKNTTPIITGEIKLPSIIPILNHNLLSGANNFELVIPRIKKTKDKIKDHNLKSPPDFIGHNDIARKMMKNNKPKLLFEGTVIFLFKFIKNNNN